MNYIILMNLLTWLNVESGKCVSEDEGSGTSFFDCNTCSDGFILTNFNLVFENEWIRSLIYHNRTIMYIFSETNEVLLPWCFFIRNRLNILVWKNRYSTKLCTTFWEEFTSCCLTFDFKIPSSIPLFVRIHQLILQFNLLYLKIFSILPYDSNSFIWRRWFINWSPSKLFLSRSSHFILQPQIVCVLVFFKLYLSSMMQI